MRKKQNGRNNRPRNNKYRSGGGGGDYQSLAKQKKHALTQKEKYLNMARDALSNGDRVEAEYYYQHVEHYSRVVGDIMAREPQPEPRQDADGEAQDSEMDGNLIDTAADDEAEEQVAVSQEAEDADDKPAARPRRKPAARKAKDHEIPLPSSMLPTAEDAPQAAAANT